ncbi:hypothetical protein CTheo_8053 [Ceratobasidium theobromae]|uniref:NodB homology domain-containing protein n=1 Tax=Ceratobasidium theobromae TaxID=1582974 RepID=A0A5N5QAS3_9AGAM|nr:hypothetical protein CTheo_8053 [Ceratobasidium theobromae]
MQFLAKLSVITAAATSLLGVLAVPTHPTLATRAPAQVITSCTKPNTVALTFDDGPYWYSYDISKMLVAAGAKGTFFVNGNNCESDASTMRPMSSMPLALPSVAAADSCYRRLKYLYGKGHQIASHTWSHAHLTTLSWDQIHDEMWRVEKALMQIIGVQPAQMRPPYGEYNGESRPRGCWHPWPVDVSEVADFSNHTTNCAIDIASVLWDFDSQDSNGASADQSKQLYDNIIAQHPSNILTLNHETRVDTAFQVLPYAISKLQAAGYQLVTVAECLGVNPYQFTVPPGNRDVRLTHVRSSPSTDVIF